MGYNYIQKSVAFTYIIIIYKKMKARKQSILNCINKNRYRKKLTQGGERLKTTWHWWRNLKMIQSSGKTHWKRLWCWEGLGAGGEGEDRGWDGWMASLTQWAWVWVNSGSWWWTGRPGVMRFMGSQRVGHDWATELNWTEAYLSVKVLQGWSFWPLSLENAGSLTERSPTRFLQN